MITVYDGSPAARGGLKPGDVITHVNGKSIAGRSSEESTTQIKGPAGSAVKLTVRSKSRTRELSLKRAEVAIPVVDGEMRDSIEHNVQVPEAHVGSNDDKLVWFELGTSKQPPRSVLGGAVVEEMDRICEIIGESATACLVGEGVYGPPALPNA